MSWIFPDDIALGTPLVCNKPVFFFPCLLTLATGRSYILLLMSMTIMHGILCRKAAITGLC